VWNLSSCVSVLADGPMPALCANRHLSAVCGWEFVEDRCVISAVHKYKNITSRTAQSICE
jgi:hypothetical protein